MLLRSQNGGPSVTRGYIAIAQGGSDGMTQSYAVTRGIENSLLGDIPPFLRVNRRRRLSAILPRPFPR